MLSFIHDTRSPGSETPEIDLGIVDSKRLQMFYVAAREGTFAMAAQILGVSPSAISHAIKALEEELGCALFKRSGPQVKPTGAAVRLMPFVEDLLFRLASIKTELAAMEGRMARLSFGVSPSVRGILRTTVMSAFHECFPRANVEVHVCAAGSEPVSGSETDFHIDYAANAPAGCVRRHLVAETLEVYAAPFHALGQQGKISPADLRRNTLLFPDRLAFEQVIGEIFQRSESGNRAWVLPDAENARDLAIQGQGLAFLPGWAVGDHVEEGSLSRLRMPGYELQRSCCAWWMPSRPLVWIAEVFLSLLAGEYDLRPSETQTAETVVSGR